MNLNNSWVFVTSIIIRHVFFYIVQEWIYYIFSKGSEFLWKYILLIVKIHLLNFNKSYNIIRNSMSVNGRFTRGIFKKNYLTYWCHWKLYHTRIIIILIIEARYNEDISSALTIIIQLNLFFLRDQIHLLHLPIKYLITFHKCNYKISSNCY